MAATTKKDQKLTMFQRYPRTAILLTVMAAAELVLTSGFTFK
jgi:hypothetical protein